MKETRYIIAGQGLAGTVLALTLHKRGIPFLAVDDPSLSNCSRGAAGLYNPIVFKRLVKSWRADELLPVMNEFYREAEKLLNVSVLHEKKIVKLFAEESEKDFWLKKVNENSRYLGIPGSATFEDDMIAAPYGGAE